MKTISAALQQGIEDGTIVTCIKATSQLDGDVEGFTSHDATLTVGGTDYNPTPGLERVMMSLRNNAEVSNQEFASAWVLDLPESELSVGKWDNAEVEVFKVDWTDTSAGTIPVFKGHIGLIQWSDDGFRADIHSSMRDLARTIGVQVTAKCRHQLFSTADDTHIGYCGVNEAAHTYTGTVNTILQQKVRFQSTAAIQSNTWCSNGIITFTSGNNNGISREIKTHEGSADLFEVFIPFPYTITAGDTFEVTAGCDKTFSTCKSKFSNGERFGGFPHIKSEINFK